MFTFIGSYIGDGVGSRNGSNATPLHSPLFWLDNIFKKGKPCRSEESEVGWEDSGRGQEEMGLGKEDHG
jgi:hypothetical protein